MTTETVECPHCGHPCIVFAYGMPIPSWEQEPRRPSDDEGFDRSLLLVVEMGCVINPLPDGSFLHAFCPACDAGYGPDWETIAWQREWGHPTDLIGAVYDPEALVEEWIGDDPTDPIDDVLVIAELATWRRDVELELAARTRALDRLIGQDDFELAERVATAALPLLDRLPSPAAARDIHAALARIASASGDTSAALERWRLALDAGELAGDRYDLSWVQADAAGDAHWDGEQRWALDLVESAVDVLEASHDRDIASMACEVATAAAEAIGQPERALGWALRGAMNELDDQDAWAIGEATRRQVERLAIDLAASTPDAALQALRAWREQLQPEQFDHHAEAHGWVTDLVTRLKVADRS